MRTARKEMACSAVSPGTPPATGTFATAGGCVLHKGGNNIVISGHLFGIESVDGTCSVEFDLRTDGSGRGYVPHQEFTQGATGTCPRKPCDQASFAAPQSEGRPWRGYAFESQTGAPEERITVLFCIEDRDADGGNRRHCNITVPFTETTNRRYTFTANDVSGSGTPRCEVTGTFTTEATQLISGEGQPRTQLEINHL